MELTVWVSVDALEQNHVIWDHLQDAVVCAHADLVLLYMQC